MKLLTYQYYFYALGLFAVCILSAREVDSRVMAGVINNQPIRLRTEILENGEYVRAVDLVPFFPDRWQYDGLSGALVATRQDGVQVGATVGYQRIVVGDKVFPIRKPVIRRQGRIFIPFHIVFEFMLPDADFQEIEADDSSFQSGAAGLPYVTPTPFQLSQSANSLLSSETPTPTPIFFSDFNDLLNDPSPTPLDRVRPTSLARPLPRAIIILDPGIGGSPKNDKLQLGIGESDITFGIARKLTTLLLQSPNFEVLLTQQENNKPQMDAEQRAGVANQNNADLFISLQCASMYTDVLSTAAVYYMNPQLDQTMLLPRETATSTGSSYLWDDAYRYHVPESLRLARAVSSRLKEFYSAANIITIDSDPRPGRLAALRGLTMPGILVELGNLSHRDTIQYLSRARIQEDLADSLYQAILDFLYERAGF
ncbi:MAG: N-acetylmuramoyl-L-alanine amidase [Candidatus Omnitrophica bacterium]|nr:N-acetylmuramoyl-L-alanine amidase [Candidatus Omnitrophota bacterium]